MSYKIIDIEGIGETYANRLNTQGIFTTDDLLEKGATKNGREEIAEKSNIPESLVITWVNHADLMRIKGVAGEYSELLEASGVDSVKELARRNAESLYLKIKETNEQFGLTGRSPAVSELQDMIDQAKKMKQKVFY